MPTNMVMSSKKGRLSLSIDQGILNRLEPYKRDINLSAQAEQMIECLLDQLENRDWAKRNAAGLAKYGQAIAATGLAGAEFDRI